jgi:hypothetical protein
MAGSASDYLENLLLDQIVGKSPSASRYIALLTAAPDDADTGSTIVEPVAMNYARITTTAASWNTASGGSVSNAAILTSPVASGDWGTITHFALCDAATAGNVLVWGELTTSKTVLNGDSLSFAVGSLIITLD